MFRFQMLRLGFVFSLLMYCCVCFCVELITVAAYGFFRHRAFSCYSGCSA
ncbi:hypothetical protein Hanom_Chr10g00951621 [Helianthus anomalus]